MNTEVLYEAEAQSREEHEMKRARHLKEERGPVEPHVCCDGRTRPSGLLGCSLGLGVFLRASWLVAEIEAQVQKDIVGEPLGI